MHEHKQEPCWDAHCAPHLTHHDAAVRELIARAEARGAERVAQAVGRLADEWAGENSGYYELHGVPRMVTLGAVVSHIRDALAEHRAPEPPSDVTEDEVAAAVWQDFGMVTDERAADDLAAHLLASFHVSRREDVA